MIFIYRYWCNKNLTAIKNLIAHVCDYHFEVTRFITGMPQKQLPVSPEGKKKKKESKGEIQISHIEVPPPAKAAELKLRESASLLQLPVVSGSGTFVYLLTHRLGCALIFSVVKTSLPQVPLPQICTFSAHRL